MSCEYCDPKINEIFEGEVPLQRAAVKYLFDDSEPALAVEAEYLPTGEVNAGVIKKNVNYCIVCGRQLKGEKL